MRGKMSERILVVDDHPLTRDALASLLAQGGFDVVGEAADGAEALELARDAPARPRPARPLDARPGRARGAAAPARGRARLRGRRPDRLRHRGEPARRDPRRRGRLPAEERAARADRRVPARRRERRGRALRRDRPPPARPASRRRPPRRRRARRDRATRSPPARSRCCSCSTSTSRTDDIAKRLFISEHTVRSHVKSLLRKLGVSSRREALEQLALARG